MLKSQLEGVFCRYHYDDNGDEWVVRVHSSSGIFPLCGCPDAWEAELVCKLIAAVIALADTTFSEVSGKGPDYVQLNNMVEYDALKEAAESAIEQLKKFAEA